MGRETKILLGLLGGLCCGLVVALVAKLLIVRPPEGAGVDVHPPELSEVGHITVEPPDYGVEIPPERVDSPSAVASTGPSAPPGEAAMAAAMPATLGNTGLENPGLSSVADGVRLAAAEEPAGAAGNEAAGGPAAFRFAGTAHARGGPEGGAIDGGAVGEGFAETDSAGGGGVASSPGGGAATDRQVRSETPPPRDPPAAREIRVGTAFVVAEGDTWWSVAERAYGDGRWYRPLYAWNKTLDPRLALRPGTRIVVPTENELEAAWAALVPERDSGPRPPRQAREAGEVVVREGDTLLSLAREHLGSASRWRELHTWNRDRLRQSPGPLSAGMLLRLKP
jgi:nucleoid-associated protein YgaU